MFFECFGGRVPDVRKRVKMLAIHCRGVAQPGSAPALGAGGRWFESSRPDHFSDSLFKVCATKSRLFRAAKVDREGAGFGERTPNGQGLR